MTTTTVLLRFADLKSRGIVSNWVTLGRWIENEGFPAGLMIGPNSRAWPEQDVADWLASRPTQRARKRANVKEREVA